MNQEVVHVHSLSRKRSQVRGTSEDDVQKGETSSGPDGNELRFERIRIQNMDIRLEEMTILPQILMSSVHVLALFKEVTKE